eukprot:2854987-Amphidinium_carterae.1
MIVRGRSMGGAAGWKGGGGSSDETVSGTESGSISGTVLGVANLDLLGGGCMRGGAVLATIGGAVWWDSGAVLRCVGGGEW